MALSSCAKRMRWRCAVCVFAAIYILEMCCLLVSYMSVHGTQICIRFLESRYCVQDSHNTAVSELRALEEEIKHKNSRLVTAEMQHEDVSSKCSQLHQQLVELEKQAGNVSGLEEQYKAALQNVCPSICTVFSCHENELLLSVRG